MIAEFEGDLIRARTREGMKIAKAKGRLRGKMPKLSTKQEAHLVGQHGGGEHTMSELAELAAALQQPEELPGKHLECITIFSLILGDGGRS